MNNCVGHATYKIFFVFVFYAVLSCIYSLVCSAVTFVLLIGSATVDSHQDAEDSSRIIHVITFNFYHEGVRAMWLAEKGGHLYSHPYDIGTFDNLTAVSVLFLSLVFCFNTFVNFFLANSKNILFAKPNCHRFWVQKFCAGYAPVQGMLALAFVLKPSMMLSWDCRLQIEDEFVTLGFVSCLFPPSGVGSLSFPPLPTR
ncbi:hypothetical protein SASPL_108739 [Salvia splendens]|uniref:Uncharacterized protein n=1 Tax=Salvia splendens TaxID=180675 RepID=A0A8X9A5N5_SALSN|nr:hypothetical protein SASPL_108739 [Salvia splendens]